MLTEAEMKRKLLDYADTFNRNVRAKEWGKAHNIYNMILTVAVMAEMPEGFKRELFGYHDSDDEEDNWEGMIKREDVDRVNMECCVRRNMAYEDIECRKLGVPVRYYSESGYCARCRKRK